MIAPTSTSPLPSYFIDHLPEMFNIFGTLRRIAPVHLFEIDSVRLSDSVVSSTVLVTMVFQHVADALEIMIVHQRCAVQIDHSVRPPQMLACTPLSRRLINVTIDRTTIREVDIPFVLRLNITFN